MKTKKVLYTVSNIFPTILHTRFYPSPSIFTTLPPIYILPITPRFHPFPSLRYTPLHFATLLYTCRYRHRINLEGCFKLCVVCISFHMHSYVLCAVQNHPILALHNHCTWNNVITQSEQQLIIQKSSLSFGASTKRSASS